MEKGKLMAFFMVVVFTLSIMGSMTVFAEDTGEGDVTVVLFGPNDVDTRPRESGSPVLNRVLNNQIVAIRTGGSELQQLNRGTRVMERMASVLNQYRNE